MNDMMTVRELADYLRLHKVTVYRLIRRGDMPAVRVGRSWRLRREDVEKRLSKDAPQRLSEKPSAP